MEAIWCLLMLSHCNCYAFNCFRSCQQCSAIQPSVLAAGVHWLLRVLAEHNLRVVVVLRILNEHSPYNFSMTTHCCENTSCRSFQTRMTQSGCSCKHLNKSLQINVRAELIVKLIGQTSNSLSAFTLHCCHCQSRDLMRVVAVC